jgi:hypothetical protein
MKRESVIEIELLDEDANRKYNCAHLNRHIVCKGDKRIVLAGQRVMKQTILIYSHGNLFVTHEMCQKRAKEREREANYLSYLLSLEKVPIII